MSTREYTSGFFLTCEDHMEQLAAAVYALNTVLISRGIITREELEEGFDPWLHRKELLREF